MTTISLEIRYHDRPAEVRRFSQPKITIGRDAGHVILGDPQSSSRHAEINVTATHVTYVDLNSTNGSYGADGQRVDQPTALHPGTQIRIGSSCIVLVSVEAGQQYGPKGTLVMQQMQQDDPLATTALAGSPAGSSAAAIVDNDIPPPSGAAQHALAVHESQPPPPAVIPAPQGFAQPGVPAYPQAGYPPAYGQQPGYGPPQPGYPQGIGSPPMPAGFGPGASPPGPQPGHGAAAAAYPGQPGPAQQYPGQAPFAQPPGAQPPFAPPPGAPAGAPPGAVSGGAIAVSGKTDPIAFTKECIAAYQPHVIEATKVIGIIAVPFGLLSAIAGYIPVLGAIFALVGGLGYGLAYLFFGLGAQAEYAMRLSAGVPISAATAWKTQLGRMFPWTFGLLVPLLIASVGCLITFVLFGLFLLPAYMIENRRMFEANKRTLDLAGKDWGMAIIPILIVAIPAGIASGIVTTILGFIPYVGGALAALWGPLFSAAITPLITFIQFRVYYQLRQQHEGVDAALQVRNQPV